MRAGCAASPAPHRGGRGGRPATAPAQTPSSRSTAPGPPPEPSRARRPGTSARRRTPSARPSATSTRTRTRSTTPRRRTGRRSAPRPRWTRCASRPCSRRQALPLRRVHVHERGAARSTRRCSSGPATSCRHAGARVEPPYPGVVIMHGGAANQEMYLWAAEGLAEAGYMVLTVNIGAHRRHPLPGDEGRARLPRSRTRTRTGPSSTPAHRPRRPLGGRRRRVPARPGGPARRRDRLLGPRPVGPDAGGPRDPHAGAVLDRRLQLPAGSGLPARSPTATPPDPLGPGNKDEDFQRVRAAGVDTMKISLRAAMHLDFTEWPELNGSRYGVVTTLYYTRAWFDRYLRGDPAGDRAADRRRVRWLRRRAQHRRRPLRSGDGVRTCRRRSRASRWSTG